MEITCTLESFRAKLQCSLHNVVVALVSNILRELLQPATALKLEYRMTLQDFFNFLELNEIVHVKLRIHFLPYIGY